MATIDFSTIESYVSVLFQTIEQNAFFILVGSIILYYMYQTIIGDKLVKTIKYLHILNLTFFLMVVLLDYDYMDQLLNQTNLRIKR